jgi:putative ABC transport system permease protein
MEAVEALYKEIFPGSLFHWYALEDHMNAHYEAEQIARNQLTFFTLIAIGIACLGLVGVISNKAISKTKEIGIRKVLGARLDQIWRILLLPTLTQIGIAVMIGIPLAYLLTQSYLQKFAERVNLEIWHFTLPILLLILLMVMSVAWVIMDAARRNPVDALKHE